MIRIGTSGFSYKEWVGSFYPPRTPGNKMLGYYAAIPYPYQVGDRRMVAGMVCDVMTHSDARGRGVFTELGRFALAEMRPTNLSFLTGYPIRPEVMGGHLRVGWEVAFDLPMYIRPLRANAIAKAKGLSWLAPVANLWISIYQATRRPRPSGEYEGRVGEPRELLCSSPLKTTACWWRNSSSTTGRMSIRGVGTSGVPSLWQPNIVIKKWWSCS